MSNGNIDYPLIPFSYVVWQQFKVIVKVVSRHKLLCEQPKLDTICGANA